MNNLGVIYKVTNLLNNKIYIGKTIQKLDKRKNAHFNVSKKSNTYFHNALKKHGQENFVWKILEETSINNLNEREIFYISQNKENSYNLTKGGDGCLGYKFNNQQLLKRSEITKNLWKNKNYKENMSKKLKEISLNNPKYKESIKKAALIAHFNKKGVILNIEDRKKLSDKTIFHFQNDKNEFIGTTYEWALLNKYPIHSSRNIVYTGKYKNWKLNKII